MSAVRRTVAFSDFVRSTKPSGIGVYMDRKRIIRRINELEGKLDARQIQFADIYIKCGDAVKAVMKMGFCKSHAEKRAFSFLKCEELG